MVSTIVTGTVVGSGEEPLLYDAELVIAGSEVSTHRRRGEVSVATDDGDEVRVHTDRATVLVARTETRGLWGELLSSPLSRPFDGEAPGDHVEVTLAGVAVRPGDRVAILGEDQSQTKADGYRGTHEVARAVDAMVVATGPDADGALGRWRAEEEEALRRAAEAERDEARAPDATKAAPDLPVTVPRALAWIGIVSLAVGVGLYVLDAGPRTLRAFLPALGIALATVGIYVVRRRRRMPTFQSLAHSADRPAAHFAHARARSYTIPFAAIGSLTTSMLAMGLAPAAVFLLAGAAIGPFFLAMALLWEERASVRFLRLLRSAPRYQRGDSGFRSLVVSLVRGKLVRERRAARQTMFATRWERWAEREDNRADVFGLLGSTEEGTEVHIHPGDAVFGSTRRSATRENAGVQDVVTVTESIGPGDQVLVLGRPHPKGEGLAVDATGPESLILFGAEGDPRRAATRALGVHFAAVVALLGLAIVGAGLAWLNPYVTRRSLSGDVTSVTGLGTVHVGDPCVVDIAHQDAAEPSLFACQAVITCGGVRLHGGFMRGFFDCDVAGDAWQTPDETSTADPRIRLVPPNHVEVRPREGQVIQILVDR